MKKILASVLSIAVVMSFAACGKKNGEPGGSDATAVTSTVETISDPSASETATVNPALEFIKGRVEKFTVPGEVDDDGVKEEDEELVYHVPEILIKSAYADSANKEMTAAAEKYKKDMKSEEAGLFFGTSYIAYLTKEGILSLVFVAYGEDDMNEYKVYNIDTKTGEKVENPRLSEIAGVSNIRQTAMDALQAWYNNMEICKVKDYKVVVENGEKKDSQMKDVESTFSEKYLNDKMQLGLTNEGKLFFITTVSTMGGADFYYWVFDSAGVSLDDEDNPFWTGERSPEDDEEEDDEDNVPAGEDEDLPYEDDEDYEE